MALQKTGNRTMDGTLFEAYFDILFIFQVKIQKWVKILKIAPNE